MRAFTPGNAGNGRTTPSSFMGHNFKSTTVVSTKMCFWVEVNMFFVYHNYYDINNIFFVFIGLERKVFAIPQLSPMPFQKGAPFQHFFHN